MTVSGVDMNSDGIPDVSMNEDAPFTSRTVTGDDQATLPGYGQRWHDEKWSGSESFSKSSECRMRNAPITEAEDKEPETAGLGSRRMVG